MKKKILITGGAGFIGTHLVKQLSNEGNWEITVLDSLIEQVHPGGTWNKPDAISFFHGDVRNRELVAKALEGIEYVVHLAAETGVGQSAYEIARYVGTNEYGTAVLLEEIAKQKTIKSLILASSRAVYGEGRYYCSDCGPVYPRERHSTHLAKGIWEPACPRCKKTVIFEAHEEEQSLFPTSVYAITKHNQEQLVSVFSKTFKIPSVILRFQNVYGPGQSLTNPYTGILSLFSTRIRNNNPVFVYEDGEELRDFVYVADVVQAILLATNYPSQFCETFNVGSGTGSSVLTVANILRAKLESNVPIQITGQYRLGDIRHAYADLKKTKETLNYLPQYSLDNGLEIFAAWVNDESVSDDGYETMTAEMQEKGIVEQKRPG